MPSLVTASPGVIRPVLSHHGSEEQTSPLPVAVGPTTVSRLAGIAGPVYGDEELPRGRLTARLTCRKWATWGQLPDSRTITRRARVITSAATLISRVRQVHANPSPRGSRSRRLLKNVFRAGPSIASAGNSAG